MASGRRIQSDIEKMLKQVSNGLSEFDTLQTELKEMVNPNQHEKIENDLKKVLKKLQKCRDQMKGWIQTEPKFKATLTDSKKQIEARMELFKTIEKTSKIKPFSKEGLYRASHDSDIRYSDESSDNFDESGDETGVDWIETVIATLKKQNAQLISQKKSVSIKNKKKEQTKKNALQSHVDTNNSHIHSLEIIQQALYKNLLKQEDIDGLDVQVFYYVDNNMNTSIEEMTDIYDGYDLAELERTIEKMMNKTHPSTKSSKPNVKQTPPIDDSTQQLIRDIEFSYSKMMDKQPVKKTPPQLPSWFPTKPAEFNFNSDMIDDTFYIFLFYFAQETPAQMIASKELKKKKWRYHKGYQKWFKRINDPVYSSEVSESGEFLCYEYENLSVATKSHFTFYYNFLDN
ncbi:CCR4-NOT transcription complex subunit 3 [Entamoeba marina]